MKNKKKVSLVFALLITLCSITVSLAESTTDTTRITTFWVSTDPVATPIATEVKFKFTVNKTSSDEVNYQYYYAEIPNGNTTEFGQDFTFIDTQILKDDEVEKSFTSSDFENVTYIGNPDDVSECRECEDTATVDSLDSVRANYMWSSNDCYPSIFILKTEIDF